MRLNIGTTERMIRAVVGVVGIALAMMYGSWWGLFFLEVTLTGIIGWSPLYELFEFIQEATGTKRTYHLH